MKKSMKKMLSLGLACMLTLAGCSSGSADNADPAQSPASSEATTTTADGNTVTVWCWDPTFNIYAMEEAAKIYNTEHPDVKIDIQDVAWEDIQARLITAMSSGQTDTLPDILLMQDNALEKNYTNYPEFFADLKDSGINFDDFADYKVAVGEIDGKNLNVPFDNGAAITALRTDVLAEAGYKIEDFNDITWDRFTEIGVDVKAKTGKPLLSCIAGEPDLLMLMLQSSGTWFFDEEGNAQIADNDVIKEIVETYVDLVEKGVLVEVNDWEQYISSLNSGSVAGTMNGCWIIGSIQSAADQSGKWGIANVPKLDVDGASNYSSQGGSSWVVKADSKNLDTAKDFLKTTFGSSVPLYETILPSSGAISTYLPAGQSEVYKQPVPFFNNEPIYATISEYSSQVPKVSYGVYNYEARDAIGVAITSILAGKDVDAALAEAQSTVEFQMGK